jgi:hypothetical protein
MDPIQPSQSAALIEALRQLGKARPSTGNAQSGSRDGADIRAERPALRDELAALVADVDPDDDAALTTIRRPMLRCILAREWGEQATNDQAFAGMVAAIDQAIADDPRLKLLIRQSVLALKGQDA